jgi:hypothetical protein
MSVVTAFDEALHMYRSGLSQESCHHNVVELRLKTKEEYSNTMVTKDTLEYLIAKQ